MSIKQIICHIISMGDHKLPMYAYDPHNQGVSCVRCGYLISIYCCKQKDCL